MDIEEQKLPEKILLSYQKWKFSTKKCKICSRLVNLSYGVAIAIPRLFKRSQTITKTLKLAKIHIIK